MNTSEQNPSRRVFHHLLPYIRRYGWLIIPLWLFNIYLTSYFVFPRLPYPELSLYIFQPLLFVSLVILVLALLVIEGKQVGFIKQRDLISIGAMLGCIQVIAGVLIGLLVGFGTSRYSEKFVYIVLNLWLAASRLAGIEMARWYFVKVLGKKYTGLGFGMGWLLPLLVLIPPVKYGLLGSPGTAFLLFGQTLIPTAAENLLAVSLVMRGGPLASIAYWGVMQAYELISPILPDLHWTAATFVRVIVPIFGLFALQQSEKGAEQHQGVGGKDRHSSLVGWLPVGIVVVVAIWLNSGFIGVRPTVIIGNSMNPTLHTGDVVLTLQTSTSKIQVGDIIRYHLGKTDVVHRVTAIHDDDTVVFTTRGDNNNSDDEPVIINMYEGKVFLIIPKVGWISILFRQALSWIAGQQ